MRAAFTAASSEAERSFGSGEVYLEKLIERPRHIEIQVMADEYGHCVYLGERECSVQRRHQKVIEEAPSAVVGEELRRRMGEAAVRLALSAGYVNAGTVEFLVESGGELLFSRDEYAAAGGASGDRDGDGAGPGALAACAWRWASRCRLRRRRCGCAAMRSSAGSMRRIRRTISFPSPGRITRLVQPGGAGDSRGLRRCLRGGTVPLEYDPMLSKLVAFGETREMAIDRMLRALDEYVIGGIKTNIGLFRRILTDAEFRAARIDTGYLERLLASGPVVGREEAVPEDVVALAAALFAASAGRERAPIASVAAESRWAETGRREGLRL